MHVLKVFSFSLDAFLNHPHHSIESDWFGVPAPCAIEYFLAASDQTLYFAAFAAAAPSADLTLPPGFFSEGLWKQDVAELFLKDRNSARYQEFNLSPAGAWWSATFARYREVACPSYHPSGVTTESRCSDSSWSALIKIPISEIQVDCGIASKDTPSSELCANVTFILGSTKQKFYTASPLPSIEPDFHRLESLR